MNMMNNSFGSGMVVEPKFFNLKEVVKGFVNYDKSNPDVGGVVSMDGTLNIRPSYQRSYIRANDKSWCEKLIWSVINNRPINLIYFADSENDKYKYEVLDGQQRLVTICEFVNGKFSIKLNGRNSTFFNLPLDVQESINNYKLLVYICHGNQSEKLEWFKTINEPNSILTDQELRNSAYSGEWLESAKAIFSAPTAKTHRLITTKDYEYSLIPFTKGKRLIDKITWRLFLIGFHTTSMVTK